MHWVDRGPEPDRLARVRAHYTPRWIAHYRHGSGTKPGDDQWRAFHDDLARVFFDLCAYCEEICRGEVDHFRPKSRFPEQVYEWSNWVFACHDCNHSKRDNWPARGYVDPCAKTLSARPKQFFDFDTLTGIIKPKGDLSIQRRQKAAQMIQDLRLNAHHHLKKRRSWLRLLAELLSHAADLSLSSDTLEALIDRREQLSSMTRVFLAAQGYRLPSR